MITREQLVKAIKVRPWFMHKCSMCNYDCSFSYKGEQLGYDSGCYCTYGSGGWTPRDESELDFYLDEARGWLPTLERFVAISLTARPCEDPVIVATWV